MYVCMCVNLIKYVCVYIKIIVVIQSKYCYFIHVNIDGTLYSTIYYEIQSDN